MNYIIKKKNNIIELDEYIKFINEKAEMTIPTYKSITKLEDENIVVPSIYNFKNITKYNYNVNQLKLFAKHHKLKISGNKKELISRLYIYLYLSYYAIKIQKIFRGMLLRKYIFLHGPAYKKRELCTNNTDFITMEEFSNLNLNQFFSYKDEDGFIYGFDLCSIYNLIYKNLVSKKNFGNNPYNRNKIPQGVFVNLKNIIHLSKVLKFNVNLEIEDDTKNISDEKSIELRTLSLFQNIDSLGNYSNPAWFLSLNRIQIVKFMRELIDIWNYRAQLSMEIKKNICPPMGDPFRNTNVTLISMEENIDKIRKNIIEILEKLVNSGVDRDSQSLGAYYVLGALTLVNSNAATSLPWLYQSVCYF